MNGGRRSLGCNLKIVVRRRRLFGNHRQAAGFTLIETLIVLGVTGALFAVGALYINGKQQQTGFNQSIRAIQTRMQQVVSDVGSGYYLNTGSVTCTKSGSQVSLSSGGTDTQGTNKDCVFLGKAVQFNVGNSDPQSYNVYTIVGLKDSSTTVAFSLNASKARLLARGSGDASSVPNDQTDSGQLQYGLTAVRMYYNNNPANTIGAVGFATNLNSLGDGDGSQQVSTVAITGTSLGQSQPDGVQSANQNLAASILNPSGGVQICYASAGTNQSGLLTIGQVGQQGTVDLKIFTGKTCS